MLTLLLRTTLIFFFWSISCLASEPAKLSNLQNLIKIHGGVKQPGSYTYKKPASLLDVIAKAGGPTNLALTKDIEIKRANGQVVNFNLEQYTKNSNRKSLPIVQPGDTVYVPDDISNAQTTNIQLSPSKNLAANQKITLMGGVKSPGSYNYNKSESLIDLLAHAGGPKRFANINSIRISHLDGRGEEFNLALYSKNPTYQTLPKLYPGDTIYIPENVADNSKSSWLTSPSKRSVQLMGAVYRPGRYDWNSDLSLLDLLTNAGGASPNADLEHIKIIPINREGAKQKAIEFNLDAFIKQGGSLESLPPIQAGYLVAVPQYNTDETNKATWQLQPTSQSIYIFGEVGNPGRYAFNSAMGFLDIISAANGPTNNANISDIRVIHRDTLRPEISKVDLGLFFKTGDPSLLPNLAPQDAIYIPSTLGGPWAYRNTNERVKILGAVSRPDSYTYTEDMNIMDVLVAAGGPMPDALFEHILVIHPGTDDRQAVNFDLEEYSKTGDPKLLPMLRVGDIVYVPFGNQSYWRRFMDKVNDVSSVLVVLRVAGVIN